ncbi:TPA: polysaccharide pyruvyl transferase family protein [Bacillus cereus]|uniref:polysaccharide pyruvyl transferase family protein n=1 Tax=Bacillus cereus group sp. FL70 TaxID=3040254 RepID=UPI0032F48ED5|nr:polysaccharide pyruvyl transferase family protein [Bacillus cereus]HDR8117381.1 polysaccharide pyruvyl transferase family protein [Bacillus cereus]
MKFLIHGYYGAGNLGDDAILENIIDSLDNEFPNSQFFIISRGLFPAYRGTKKVESINVNLTTIIREKMKTIDAVIIGGGGLLQDHSGWQPQNNTFGTKAKGMNYYGQIVNLATELKKDIYFYSIGIGPFFSLESQNYACSLLKKAKRITVRDQESYDFVTTNLSNSKVLLTADPALNLENIPRDKALHLLKKENVPVNKKLIGICLRPWKFKNTERENLLNNIAEFSILLSKKENVHFVLCPLSQYKGDKQIMEQLAKKLPEHSYTLLQKNYRPKNLKSIFGEFSLMIGMRLHSLILSVSMNVPIIGISYDPKINHFINIINQNPALFSYHTIPVEKMLNLSIQLINMSNSEKQISQNKIIDLKKQEKLNT